MASLKEKRFFKPQHLDPEEKEALLSRIKEGLLQHPEILFAYVHGSFVKEKEFRDIDVGIYISGPRGAVYDLDLSHELSQRMGMDVEVRAIQEAPIAFQMAVVRDGRLLFSRDDELRTSFLEQVSKKYPEYAHFRNLFLGIEGARRE